MNKNAILIEVETPGNPEGAIEFTRGLARVIARQIRPIIESGSVPATVTVSVVPMNEPPACADAARPIDIPTIPVTEIQSNG